MQRYRPFANTRFREVQWHPPPPLQTPHRPRRRENVYARLGLSQTDGECHRATAPTCSSACPPWAAPGCVGLHASLNDSQEDAPHLVEHCHVALHYIGISTKASIAQVGELESVFF